MGKKTNGCTVEFTADTAKVFKKAADEMRIDDTGNMEWGDYTFKITVDNMMNLDVLCKYAQMLDFVTNSKGEDELNIDGVVNEVLDEALSKRVKGLAKKHGFIDAHDLIESLDGCKDGEEVAHAIEEAERMAYARAHERILAHVLIEDRQKKLFDAK